MKFIGLVGTNSKRSTNRQLLQYIQKHFADKADIELVEIKDLPVFNKPANKQLPESVLEIVKKIDEADGVIIGTVPHHHRLTIGVGAFAPYVIDVHQHIAPVIYALENFVIFVHCDHPVIDAVGLTVAVKGQLRVGHDGVEEQMLHHAVPRYIGHAVHGAPVNGGGGDDVWLLLGFLRLLGRLRGGVGGLRLRSVIAGLGGRVRLGRAAAGGERTGQQKG